MNKKIYKDIHFNPGENDDFFDVDEKIVYGFFLFRTFKSKTGLPFNIRNVHGPYHQYYDHNFDLIDLISVTFVYHKSDVGPFVLILEKSNTTINYYGMINYNDTRWKLLTRMKGFPNENKIENLLVILKTQFSYFYKCDIELGESLIKYQDYGAYDCTKYILKEYNYIGNYDKYYIKTNKQISLSNIIINTNEIEINKSLRFVEKVYFYYQKGYEGNPLMMETVDYQIAGSLPYINYFIPESVGNKWVPVEFGTHLLGPKCKSDIKRILDGVVEMYRNHPITIDITKPYYGSSVETIIRFSDVRFSNVRENGEYFISHIFTSKVTKSFFIDNIMFDNVKQEIDIQSTEFESITVYYKVEQPHRPLLICLKLHNKTNTDVEKFKWFYITSFEKNIWLKLDFEAHSHNDNILIEQKIKSMYGSKSIINYIMIPLKWFTVLALIFTIVTLLLFRQRRRLRLILFRLYHNILW